MPSLTAPPGSLSDPVEGRRAVSLLNMWLGHEIKPRHTPALQQVLQEELLAAHQNNGDYDLSFVSAFLTVREALLFFSLFKTQRDRGIAQRGKKEIEEAPRKSLYFLIIYLSARS